MVLPPRVRGGSGPDGTGEAHRRTRPKGRIGRLPHLS